MLDQDEQMALLVMRVSGTMHGHNFYPEMAGVGFSFNPYAWHESIAPKAGVMRLVFGLGTRAVDQADDDYTRIVALNAPDKRPEANFDEVAQYTQRRVDYLDLEANQEVSDYFQDLVKDAENLPIEMFASIDKTQPRSAMPHRILTFDKLLGETGFVADIREILDTIEAAYNYPVDIEFTANFIDAEHYRINLLQCRPLQVHGSESIDLPDVDISSKDRIVEAHGAGQGGQGSGQGVSPIFYTFLRCATLFFNRNNSPARESSMLFTNEDSLDTFPICNLFEIHSFLTLVCLRTSHATALFRGSFFLSPVKSASDSPMFPSPASSRRSASSMSCLAVSSPTNESRRFPAITPSSSSIIRSRNSPLPKHHPRRIFAHASSTSHGFALQAISTTLFCSSCR